MGFCMVGFFVVIGAMIANIFLQIGVILGLSAGIILLMSAILMQTSAIVRGGETIIMATYSLYLLLQHLY